MPQQPGVDWAVEADKVRSAPPAAPTTTAAPTTDQPDWHAVADDVRSGNFQADPRQLPILNRPPSSSGAPFITDPQLWSGLGNIADMGAMVAAPELLGPMKGVSLIGRIAARMTAAGAGGAVARGARDIAGQQTEIGAPPTAGNITRDAASAFKQGATGEGVAQALPIIAEPVKRAVSATFRAPITAGRAVVDRLAGPPTAEGQIATEVVGGPANLTKAQQRSSEGLSSITKYVRGSLFSGGLNKTVARGRTAVEDAAGKILDSVGPATTPEEAGTAFQRAREVALDAAKNDSKDAYAKVDQLARGGSLTDPGVRVKLDSLQSFAEQEEAKRGDLGMALTSGKSRQMINAAKPPPEPEAVDPTQVPGAVSALQSLAHGPMSRSRQMLIEALSASGVGVPGAEAADAVDQGLTFSQAHEVRAAFGRIQRTAQASNSEFARQDYGLATQFKNRIDAAMTEAAGGANTPLRQAYDEATTGYKTLVDTYYRGLLKQTARQSPETIVGSVVKPGRVGAINQARDTVGPQGWQPVQYATAERLLTDPTGGVIAGDQLAKRLTALRPETLNAVYPNGEAAQLQKLATTTQQLTHGEPGPWQMRIQIGEGVGLISAAGLLASGHPGLAALDAGSIILTPKILGRILMNPAPRKALMDGLSAAAVKDPTRAARAAGQLTTWLVSQGLASTSPSSGPPTAAPTAQPMTPSAGKGGGAGPLGLGPPPAAGAGGQLSPGNIDLSSRPRVQNRDGSVSTVRSISINEDGKEILIPTVSPDGRVLSNAQAIDLYHRTGQHLGMFKDAASATAAAQRIHANEAAKLGPPPAK